MIDFWDLFCKGICNSLGSQIVFSLLKTLLKIKNPVFVLVLSQSSYANNCYLEKNLHQ